MPRSTTDGSAAERPGGAARGRSRRNFAGSRPVMDDVARLAGVSKQTVSRVLNDNPAVRAETREAVLEAMRTLGYRPSRSARSLASGRTRMLGVISFDAARYGPASTLTAINTAAQEAGYLVSSIALDTADRDTVVQAVDRLSAEGADGIIAIAPQRPVATALARSRPDTPMVMLDNGLGDGTPVVSSDFTGAPGWRPNICWPSATPPSGTSRARPAGPPPTDAPRAGARPCGRPAHASTNPSSGTGAPTPATSWGGGSRTTRTSPPCSSPTTRWRSACCAPCTRPGAGSRTT